MIAHESCFIIVQNPDSDSLTLRIQEIFSVLLNILHISSMKCILPFLLKKYSTVEISTVEIVSYDLNRSKSSKMGSRTLGHAKKDCWGGNGEQIAGHPPP